MAKIMIVEDDEVTCNELKELLENSGDYEVTILKDFQHSLEEILNSSCDLVLLDIQIPYLNGEALLQKLREKSNVPVIMVTSKNVCIDEALCMSYGADDYITKPYHPNILLLRIEAVLKRASANSNFVFYKDAKVHLGKGTIQKGNLEVVLTKNEMIIFSYLLSHYNKIVTRDELMTDLWNNDEFINDNALTVNISRLRAKLKSIGYSNAIDTRKGQGYILL